MPLFFMIFSIQILQLSSGQRCDMILFGWAQGLTVLYGAAFNRKGVNDGCLMGVCLKYYALDRS